MSIGVTSPKDLMASDEYQLDRQATACKKAGDWDGAIAALRQRKAIMGVQYTDTKLAKYLQQAGRFDDAMAEVQWLADHAQAWAVGSFSHQPATVVQCQRAGYLARVYGDAVLMCKRAKRPDLQAQYQQRQDAYSQLWAKLKPLADADAQRLKAGWAQARLQGREAMAAYAAERQIGWGAIGADLRAFMSARYTSQPPPNPVQRRRPQAPFSLPPQSLARVIWRAPRTRGTMPAWSMPRLRLPSDAPAVSTLACRARRWRIWVSATACTCRRGD